MAKNEISERTKYTHSLRDFKGVNTRAARQNIGDDQFAWLENLFPLGYGNMQALYGPSGILGSWPTGTATFFKSFNLNFTPVLIVFTSTGGGYNINLENNMVTQFAADATFSGTTFATSWSDTNILIIDNTKGYYTYDGTTLTKVTGTIQSISITSAGNGYTSAPTIGFSGGGGSGAAATTDLQLVLATVSAAGTGYQIGDILTISGGTTGAGGPAQLKVTAVGASNAISGFNIINTGDYTAIPTSPASVTGGFGSSATFTLNFGVGPVTLTNPGTGYTSAPTVTLTGGAGSGAVLTANLSVAPSAGNQIAVYSSRVWISNGNRTVIFSAPGSFTDFSSAGGGGSFVIDDSTLINIITALYTANNYLYIFGKTSINVISGVQVVNGITVFSNTNISASIGTNEPSSVTPYYRGLAFMTRYGFYVLNGTTCQKISDDLDGYWSSLPQLQPSSGGYFNINNNICLAFLNQTYGNIYANRTRALVSIFFDKKWTFSSQGDSLTYICPVLYNGNPILYGTDGKNFYQLFQNPNIAGAYSTFLFQHLAVSKLWDMDDPVREKQSMKIGIETNNSANPSTVQVTGILDTEIPTNYAPWFFQVTPIGNQGYFYGGTDVETYGRYIGFQSTDQVNGIVFSAFHIQYEKVAAWATNIPTSGAPPIYPPAPTPSPGPAPAPAPSPLPAILTATAGYGQITLTWLTVPGATSYNLYWSTTPGAGTSGTKIPGLISTTYVHTGLTVGTTYYYVVTAVNVSGESGPSNQASATPFFGALYVADNGSGNVYQYKRDGTGKLSALSPASISNASANGISVSADGSSVYCTGNNVVFQYSRNTTTGLLTALSPSSVATGNGPIGVEVTPNGKFAYVSNSLDNTISQYSRAVGGALTALSPATASVTNTPQKIAIHPSGNYLYSSNFFAGFIDQFSIGANGQLTHLSPGTAPVFSDVYDLVCSPNGNNLYAVSIFGGVGTLFQFAISSSGTLGAISGEVGSFGVGTQPEGVAVSPDSKNVYVSDLSAGRIYQFSADIVGGLSAMTPAYVAAGTGPRQIWVSPDGLYVYATDQSNGHVLQFSRNSAGILTALSPSSVTGGTSAIGVVGT